MRWLGAILTGLLVIAGAHVALAQQPTADEAAGDAAAAKLPPRVDVPQSTSMDALLKRVRVGWAGERKEMKQRLIDFKNAKSEQQRLLNDAKNLRASLERRSEALETQFEGNELALTTLEPGPGLSAW